MATVQHVDNALVLPHVLEFCRVEADHHHHCEHHYVEDCARDVFAKALI